MSEKKYKLNFIFATDLKYLPMTKLFLPCLLALLITSCHKQKMQLNSDVVSADNQENTYSSKIGSDITYPEVVFKKQYRSKNEYVVILKDENFKNYNNLQIQAEFFTHENSSGLPTGKRMHKPFIFTKELDKSIPTIKSEGVEFESALENLIVDVVLTYMVKGEKVKTDNYSIYVGKDGKADLQAPTFKTVHFVDDWQGESVYLKGKVIVANDPARIVKSIQIEFIEPFSEPKPINQRALGNIMQANGSLVRAQSEFNLLKTEQLKFSSSPNGFTYPVALTMLDADGKIVEKPYETKIEFQKGKSIPKIIDIRFFAKERNSHSKELIYIPAIAVENIDWKNVSAVEMKFNQPIKGPSPSQLVFRCRKRPDILTAEWDDLLDESRSVLIQNPLYTGSNHETYNPLFDNDAKPLTFSGNPLNNTYSVTVTLFDIYGKPMGESFTQNVLIHSNVPTVFYLSTKRLRSNSTISTARVKETDNIRDEANGSSR